MAKQKAAADETPKPPRTTRAVKAAKSAEVQALIAKGCKPYTVIAGTHREIVSGEDGLSDLSEPYKVGDTFYSLRNYAEKYPEKFVAGECMVVAGRVVDTPGLGEEVTDEINNGGYELFQKNGIIHAYAPGSYGSPVSGALLDLAAAEEWVEENPLA